MVKHCILAGLAWFVLSGCDLGSSIENPEASAEPTSKAVGQSQVKNELAYGYSVVPDWFYVDRGWDAAAGAAFYYYIRDSDRAVFKSPTGLAGSWENMNYPGGKANRIAACNGVKNGSSFSFRGDKVAVVGEDGYIYLWYEWLGSWYKLTARGNFIDVAWDLGALWAIGSNNLMYSAGDPNNDYINGATNWTPQHHSHISRAMGIEDGSSRVLISNTSSKLYWWNNSWIYRDASNVRDICGNGFGNFNGWGNFWIVSNSGQLNYHSTVNSSRWVEWRATNVSRVGCSTKSRLIVVNFDRTTYVKNEAVTSP